VFYFNRSTLSVIRQAPQSCNSRCLRASTTWRCGCGPIDYSSTRPRPRSSGVRRVGDRIKYLRLHWELATTPSCQHHQCVTWVFTSTPTHQWRRIFPEPCPAASPYRVRSAALVDQSHSRLCNRWWCPWYWHASITAIRRWPAWQAINSTDCSLWWMLLHGSFVHHGSATTSHRCSTTFILYACHSGLSSSSLCLPSVACMVWLRQRFVN